MAISLNNLVVPDKSLSWMVDALYDDLKGRSELENTRRIPHEHQHSV